MGHEGEGAVRAVDLGTGGPKTALVATSGEVLGCELVAVRTTMLAGGGAIQDPGARWAAIRGSVHKMLDAKVVAPDEAIGVACTGQWGSSVPVVGGGEPVGPCLSWMDARGGKDSPGVLGGTGPLVIEGYGPSKALRFIRKTGGAPALQGNDPLGQILYLRHEEPEVYRAASVFLEPVDYLALRLTGRAVATPASMILSWLVDIRDLARPKYAAHLVKITTRDPRTLPELVPTGSVVGGMLGPVARELDLPEGIPVVSGVPDLLSATTGSGALGDFEMHMAISTSSWLSGHVPFKRTDPFRQVASVPGIRPGRYVVANNHDTAGICLQWFREAMYAPAPAPAPGAGGPGEGAGASGSAPHGGRLPSYEELAVPVEATPPGSGGVLFAPWLTGERCPVDDRTLRGSFLNISLGTTREEMLRAVFEGVAFDARWMQDAVEHFTRRPVGPVRFIGGGASSAVWCQIHADILERPVHQVREPLLANARGAGLYGALALGRIDLAGAAGAVEVARVFEPQVENRALYRELYGQFTTLYRQQRRMYRALNRPGGALVSGTRQ